MSPNALVSLSLLNLFVPYLFFRGLFGLPSTVVLDLVTNGTYAVTYEYLSYLWRAPSFWGWTKTRCEQKGVKDTNFK